MRPHLSLSLLSTPALLMAVGLSALPACGGAQDDERYVAPPSPMLGRALLEVAGTNTAFIILMSFCIMFGYAEMPERPLYLAAGIGYLFWVSLGVSMIITGGTHERTFWERMVHPFTYFMIPLSGAFYMVGDIESARAKGEKILADLEKS